MGGLVVIPERVYKFSAPEDYNRKGAVLVGSGPYMLQTWDRGQQIVMLRNPYYWGEKPTFDKLIFKFIQNPQAALQALQNAEIDADGPDPDQWVKLSVAPDFTRRFTCEKYARVDAGFGFIGYNEVRPMFRDKLTRQALTMLLDRNAIIHTFQRDLAKPITGPFNPLSPQYDASIKAWPYDVEGAKKKLAEAGWKPGSDGVLERDGQRFEFKLSMGTGNPVGDRIANYVKEQFARGGIRMTITPCEFSVFTERLDNRDFDAAFLGWSGSVEDDPYQTWDSASIKDKGSNFISFDNKESDALIEEGRRTLDEGKRMAIWHRWQALIHEEEPYTFLYTPLSRVFINKRFKNTEPYKVGLAPYDWYVAAGDQKYK